MSNDPVICQITYSAYIESTMNIHGTFYFIHRTRIYIHVGSYSHGIGICTARKMSTLLDSITV